MAIRRNLALPLAALAVLAIGATSYGLIPRSSARSLDALTFSSLDGRQLQLQDLRGKVVMVTFWATSCAICLSELPELVQTYRDYQARGFELIAVAMAYDSRERVKRFASEKNLPFPVAFDSSGELARTFDGTWAVPTTFVIDKTGTLLSRTLGAIDFAKLRDYLDASLGRPGMSVTGE